MNAVKYLTVSVDELRKNIFNSNKVSAQNEEKIRASIQRNGLFKPIIVRSVEGVSGYEIIGGEHRWEQAVELGYAEVPIADMGTISDAKAKEISVIDNARYGIDDTLMFADLLKDIGGLDEVSQFLPYGESDLSAIFNASTIALDDLGDVPEIEEPEAALEEKTLKPAKTHTIMRFKASLGDAERITALIARTQKAQGFTTGDDLTNAGDAITFLLGEHMTPAAAVPENWTEFFDEIEAEQEKAK